MLRNKVFAAMAATFFVLTTQASAAIIDITYTGQIFGGTANGSGTFCSGSCSPSGFTWDGQAFTLVYVFDTSLATAGNYINTGSSSQVSGSFSSLLGGSFVGFATGLPSVSGFNPAICAGLGCSSSESDTASVGSTYSQSVSWQLSGTGATGGSVSTALFANGVIPGDITAAFFLSGSNIGSGSFASFASPGVVCGNGASYLCLAGALQIESVAVVVTPLPATLPLFTTGLGMLGLLGLRRKRKAAARATID